MEDIYWSVFSGFKCHFYQHLVAFRGTAASVFRCDSCHLTLLLQELWPLYGGGQVKKNISFSGINCVTATAKDIQTFLWDFCISGLLNIYFAVLQCSVVIYISCFGHICAQIKVCCVVVFSAHGQCQPGWREYENKCYFFSTDTKSWMEANAFCLEQNSNLMSIQDIHERVRQHTQTSWLDK